MLVAAVPNPGILGAVLLGYLAVMVAIGLWARSRITDPEQFLVAGRRLPLSLAAPTLLATWFGAGTLLTATDEVRAEGLKAAALDPIGAGLCLVLAGVLLARKLWAMRLITLADFFRERFGPRAERWAALLMVPTYFGWIAAQFVALAGLIEVAFGLDPQWGIALVAVLGTAYTLAGGMWSVTLTDALQMALVAGGLLLLTVEVLGTLGDGSIGAGWSALWQAVPVERQTLVPHDSAGAVVGWVGVLAIGSLGNLPGQDLMQRIFASRSARTAVGACVLAGVAYLLLGALPTIVGLAADVVAPQTRGQSTLTALAGLFLSPAMSTVLLLAVVSAVLSTIDSAILSPASVISENLFGARRLGADARLAASRRAVALVAAVSCAVAYVGADAYELLESAYALGLVSLLVPLLGGVWGTRAPEHAALTSMAVGTATWLLHMTLGWEAFGGPWLAAFALPVALCSMVVAAVAYVVMGRRGD